MNEDEVLAQLRDIHLPAEAVQSAPVEFALWPFLVLVAIAGVVLLVRAWRGAFERRQAIRELEHILSVHDDANRWQRLLAYAARLSARIGGRLELPDVAFQRPDRLSADERTSFVDFLKAKLGR